LITAASAGLILWAESRRFPGHEVTFGKYLVFGLPASLAMLVFYIVFLTFVH
jgi:Na+/H+ antiporter NhaD/arsenite permease-like protein